MQPTDARSHSLDLDPAVPGASGELSIADLLTQAARPLFSFEFFPPKDAEGDQMLRDAVDQLQALHPDFVSVTYGANGSSRDKTLSATERIQREAGLRTMGHLTCASQSRDELVRVIADYQRVGISHILAIRGDMPGGPTQPWQRHPEGLANATELVELVSDVAPDMCIGVGAFPDVHPASGDADLDAKLLVAKAEAGASFAITQMFFSARRYVELVDRVRSHGCDLPIIPGIQPVTRLGQIARFAEFSGAALPAELVARLEAAAPDRVRSVGSEAATELCLELLAGGAPGLHFFTQNRSTATREILAMILEHRRSA